MQLKVTENTVLKVSPIQSSQLADNEKLSLPLGIYEIEKFDDKGNHLLIDLAQPLGGRTEWYIFEGHIEALTLDPYPEHTDKTEPKKQGTLKLPGYSETFYLADPILSQGNFTWAEATKNGTRIPVNKLVVDNIITMAKKMEEIRMFLGGNSISVTSWYRDPVTNRRVGGASQSTHIQGYGVDFNVSGLTPQQAQQRLENFWKGGLGYGRTFTHLDNRNYRARWNYGS